MFPKYFQDELFNLRQLGSDFSRAHPALAPMLSGPQADPDVERLLEGTAFLTALMRQKLDDEFPEIVHDLLAIIAPHYLNPIPAATILAFQPKATVRDSITLPAGVYGASIPIEGITCLFQTRYETEIHPIALTEVTYVQSPGRPPMIKLVLELNGLPLSEWHPRTLRLYLADGFAKATDLYLLLRRHLKAIHLVSGGNGKPCTLSPSFLRPVGFVPFESLMPYPSQAYPGFGILQDYFVLPQKFLFLNLVGWEQWQSRGSGSRLEIHFELADPPFVPARLTKESFVLHATPAINVFPHEADPVYVDHRKSEYHVRPAGRNADHYQIFSVDDVTGFVQGTSEQRRYAPFDLFRPGEQSRPVFHLSRKPSTTLEGIDHYLSVAYPPNAGAPAPETLAVHLRCTNGSLPGRLKTGDIAIHGKGCPEYVSFRNILPPSPGVPPPIGKNLLWRLVSHLALGFQSLERIETLKSLLELYILPDSSDYAALANRKRVDGILAVSAAACDRLVDGILMRGKEITLRVREDHFAGFGDLYLFGCVLDAFFGNYASINSFTTLILKDWKGGRSYVWPARIGNRTLI